MSVRAKTRWFRGFIVLLACVGGALAVWRFVLRDQIVPRNFGIVEQGHVYRSAALTPGALRRVHDQYGVKTIIDLGAFDKDPTRERVAQETATALGINRLVFPLEGDGRGNPNAYVAALRVLNNPASHPVLICCSAGAQRTSACVMLYRKLIQGKTIEKTYPESFAFGHSPADNRVLMPYLVDWADDIERAFRDGSDIPGFSAFKTTPGANALTREPEPGAATAALPVPPVKAGGPN